MSRVELLLAAVVFAAVSLIYSLTSAPGLGMVDSGELTTVAATLGIAHPTGYPLYSLVGRAYLLLTPFAPDRGMVLFSVTVAALAAALLALSGYQLLRAQLSLRPDVLAVSAALLAVGWSLAAVPWESVAFAEVYPLSALGTALLIFLAVRVDETGARDDRLPLLALFVWGLALGNHLTVLWQFPLVLFVLSRRRTLRELIPLLPWGAAVMALGLSVNFYLPLRSSVEPSLDWGDPETPRNILRHLSAWQYQVWMFKGSLAAQIHKLTDYVAALPPLWGWPTILLVALGVLGAAVRKYGLPLCAFAAWFISVGYNLNYDIPDINTYEVVAFPDLLLLIVCGVLAPTAWVGRLSSRAAPALGVLLLCSALLPIAGFAMNYPRVDSSSARFASAFTRELLRTVDSNAVIFQGNWDIQSAAIYEQQVNGYRRDVALFDLNLLQRSWYFPSQRRDHPALCEPCEADYARFLTAVRPFEADQPVDGARIEDAYTKLANCMIAAARAQARPVYLRDLASVNHPGVGAGLPRIPGAYFDLLTDSTVSQPPLNFAAFDTTHSMRDAHVRVCLREAVASTVRRGSYLASSGDSVGALAAARIVSDFAPGLSAVRNFRQQLGLPPLTAP